MGTQVYPTTISGRNVYYAAAIPYVTTNAVRLQVAPDKLTALNNLYDNISTELDQMGYVQLMVLYGDKSTNTTPVKDERRARDKALQNALSSIYDDIPGRVWTKTDRDVLGRKGPVIGHKPETTSTEKTQGTNAPVADLSPSGSNALVLRVNQTTGQKGVSRKREGKSKNIREYVFHYLVHKTTDPYPVNANACTEHLIITKLPHKMNFTPDQAGMRCSGFVQNIEKPAKPGAVSKLVTAIIPG